MRRIKIIASDYGGLRRHLLRGTEADEEAAFLLAARRSNGDDLDCLVREVIAVPDSALLSKGRAGLEIDPVFIAGVLKRARLAELSLWLCHSHPFSDRRVGFSSIDDGGEAVLFPRLQQHVPDAPHGALVFGQRSVAGRAWLPGSSGSTPLDELVVVGPTLDVVSLSTRRERRPLEIGEAIARQVLALQEEAQRRVGQLKVGLIGAGGVGSVVFDGLVRIGVGEIVTVDGDRLAKSNVSREVGAGLADVGHSKVEVLAAAAERVGFGTRVVKVPAWVQAPGVAEALLGCDLIVAGVDTMKARVFAARLGIQHMVPVISVGIDVVPGGGETIEAAGGHVAVQLPDGPCLDCLGLVDHEMLDAEQRSSEPRVPHPYEQGRDPNQPAPSIVVLNQVVGGLVGLEVLQLATSRLRPSTGPRSYLVFDGRTGETRRVLSKAITPCGVCDQVRAWGDRFPLPIEEQPVQSAGS